MTKLFDPADRIEFEYRSALRRLMKKFSQYLRDFGFETPSDFASMLSAFTQTDYFDEFSRLAASRMVTSLRYSSAKSWREAAQQGTRGRTIFAALQNELRGPVGAKMLSIIEENAELIKSFPSSVTNTVNRFIEEESLKGRRPKAIAEDLIEQYPDIAEWKVNLVARTETAKAATALNRVRCDELGVDWYVWRANRDARLRPSHRYMNDVIVAWREPASPETLHGDDHTYGAYNPGEIFNCRCHAEPLLRLDQVQWPHRVFSGGVVRSMTRREFESLGGMRVAA